MTWRRKSHEEVEELRQFVEEMKRGVTTATGDSLLETLRQIHDGREAPSPAPDHRRLLLERLRREMAERDGAQPPERPVLTFPRASRTPVVLKWALAASLVVHLGLGGVFLSWLRQSLELFQASIGGDETAAASDPYAGKVLWLPLSAIPRDVVPTAREDRDPGTGSGSNGASRSVRPSGHPQVPAQGRAPAGPMVAVSRPAARPVAGAAVPMIDDFAASDSLAETSLAEPGDFPILGSPGTVESFTEVMGASIDKDFDEPPRIISTARPEYPVRALSDQIQGSVKLRCVFDVDGTVRDVKVVRGLGYGLDEAASRAVRQIRFRPAMRNGVAVPVTREFVVRFGIR